jgi:hypothetical protein
MADEISDKYAAGIVYGYATLAWSQAKRTGDDAAAEEWFAVINRLAKEWPDLESN